MPAPDTKRSQRIKPGSTFPNLEAVLAALGVTVRVETFGPFASFASYAAWQATMLTGGAYDAEERVLDAPPGPGQRAALEWGIGAALAHGHGFDFKDPAVCRALFCGLELHIVHAPPVVDELPSGVLDGGYTDEELVELRRLVAAGHVDVVQVNPVTEAIYDAEDRQQTMFMWCSTRGVVRIVLAAVVDDEDREHLREQLGVKLDELPVRLHGASQMHIDVARQARDKLRAWRAERPSPAGAAPSRPPAGAFGGVPVPAPRRRPSPTPRGASPRRPPRAERGSVQLGAV